MRQNQLNWDDVRLFLTIAQEGSFRRAATVLGVGHTTLSRRIEALESNLDTRLFNRLPHGLSLTTAGYEMLQTAIPVHREFDELALRMFGQDQQAAGPIRFTAPDLVVNYLLIEPLSRFCQEWPDITLTVDSSHRLLDLTSREADIAIRCTNNPGEHLLGRRLGTGTEAAYASKDYLGWFEQQQPPQHRWIRPSDDYSIELNFKPEFQTQVPHQVVATMADPQAQRLAAQAGLGIATIPCFMGDATPDLVRISDTATRYDIWMLSHPDTRHNKRMRVFREYLVSVFECLQTHLDGVIAPD